MTDKAEKEKTGSALHIVPGVRHERQETAASRGSQSSARNPRPVLSTEQFVHGVLDGDRSVLARAVTLVESNAPDHQQRAQAVLQELMPHTGKSIRIGVTGLPGSGKSTLIEALGMRLVADGHRVAVLTIDPSSTVTRGSILGDKTRMERLAREPGAFIRPSPSGGILGGVARKTRESILIFEAAGFDVILVETMGVGQSEVRVRSMVDFVLMVLIPGAGDILQGVKRGAMELADALIVNKADGSNRSAAEATCAEFAQALHFLQPATEGWTTSARIASALEGTGLKEIWDTIETFRTMTKESGAFDVRRQKQALEWLHYLLEEGVKAQFYRHPNIVDLLPQTERDVATGTTSPTRAALALLEAHQRVLEDNNDHQPI